MKGAWSQKRLRRRKDVSAGMRGGSIAKTSPG
jgi:hypothetical protein